MTTKKPKTVRLDAFIENPDNPQTVTDDAFALLVESIRATPQTLAASKIAYANGAVVSTSFVTSLSDFLAETRPDLYKVIEDANEENLKATAKVLPKLSFPHAVATSARLQYLTKHGIRFAVKRSDAAFIRRLDAQEKGDAIFGGALLLCERAAAERAAAKTFELSPRELELQKTLG